MRLLKFWSRVILKIMLRSKDNNNDKYGSADDIRH